MLILDKGILITSFMVALLAFAPSIFADDSAKGASGTGAKTVSAETVVVTQSQKERIQKITQALVQVLRLDIPFGFDALFDSALLKKFREGNPRNVIRDVEAKEGRLLEIGEPEVKSEHEAFFPAKFEKGKTFTFHIGTNADNKVNQFELVRPRIKTKAAPKI